MRLHWRKNRIRFLTKISHSFLISLKRHARLTIRIKSGQKCLSTVHLASHRQNWFATVQLARHRQNFNPNNLGLRAKSLLRGTLQEGLTETENKHILLSS